MTETSEAWPDEGDLVVCSVKSVKENGAYLDLDGYPGREGFVFIGETTVLTDERGPGIELFDSFQYPYLLWTSLHCFCLYWIGLAVRRGAPGQIIAQN